MDAENGTLSLDDVRAQAAQLMDTLAPLLASQDWAAIAIVACELLSIVARQPYHSRRNLELLHEWVCEAHERVHARMEDTEADLPSLLGADPPPPSGTVH